MKKICIILVLIIMAEASWAQIALDLYISPAGSDNNSGTIEHPFFSIEKAKETVRTELAKNPDQKINVYLRGGDYFVHKTIRFDDRDGSANAVVKYSGYQKEKVVIHGGVPVTGWEKYSEHIYRAKIPDQLSGKDFYRLFDDGQSAVLARYPNFGSGFGGGLKRINNTTIQVPVEWKDYDFSKAQIYGWIGSNWFAELRAIQHFDKEKLQLIADPGSNNFGGLNDRLFIQGVPELLDVENEWCIKKDSIYYYPSGKANINSRLIVAPAQARVIEIQGRSTQQLIENVGFENLEFCGSDFTNAWRIFDAGKDATMPVHLQEGLIYIENAKNVSIRYCSITGAGHSAVYVNNKSESCTVWGCSISYAGFCGIYANSYMPGEGGSDGVNAYINKRHNFSNNFIHHCGFSIGGGCGIQLFQSGDNRITHNVICDMPRYGISCKGICNSILVANPKLFGEGFNYDKHFEVVHCRNNYIAFNEIFNVCRSSFDFGAIESWGAGKSNVWDNNAIHDIDQSVEWDGWAHGLFSDDASDFVTLKNNIVFELKGGKATGAVMVKSINEEVSNNIFADNAIGRAATMAPYAEPAMNNILRNNIFYNSGEILYDVDKNSFGKGFNGYYKNEFNEKMVSNQKVFAEVDSNLIYPLYFQTDTIKKYGWDVHSITSDPLFDKKNPQWNVTYKDYRLKPSSPVAKIGFNAVNYDSIGLLADFPFNTNLLINAGSLIQVEDYQRMKDLRCMAATGIYHIGHGAWAKYDNIDFGKNDFNRFICNMTTPDANDVGKVLFEIRLDSPEGELIGTIRGGETQIRVKPATGVHNCFLVFQRDVMLDSFRFLN
jgi:hypothetical protein